MGNLKEKLSNIKNYFGEVFTVIIILALIVYSFVSIGFRDSIDENFFIAFAVNFGIMILVTSIWYPAAKQKAQTNDAGYLAQRKKYGELVDKVIVSNNQKNLNKFCEYATEQNRIFKIKKRLIDINVDYDIYVKYSKCPSSVDNEKELTDKQKRKLKALIINGVKVKKISYSRIITGVKSSKARYDTNSDEQKYDTFKILSKMLVSVASSLFSAFMVFYLYGFSWASIAQFFVWLILIFWNIFTSYNAGYKSISIKRADYYKKLKTFLEEFVSSEYFYNETKPNEVELCEN